MSTDRAVLAALIVGAAALLLPLRPYGLIINDEGWYLYPAMRMLDGDVLYRDTWTFYAPLRYHLLEFVFTVTGPSILVARTVWVFMIVASGAGLYRLARRFVAPSLAWLPAVVYLLVPGPWHKAPYALCTVGFFLCFARALERPTRARLLLLGGVAGVSLMARQELGLAQICLALALAAGLPWIRRQEATPSGPPVRTVARDTGLVLVAWAAAVAPVLAWYAAHGALGALLEALFVRGFVQMGGWPLDDLRRLFSLETLGTAPEGGRVGALFVLLPALYVGFGVLLLVELWRSGPTPRRVLVAALLALAIPTLAQAYRPPALIRLLQSAVPFYLLMTWATATLAERLGQSGSRSLARAAVPAVTAASGLAAVWLVWLVLAGVPTIVPSDAYSGSLRSRRYSEPTRVLGDEVITGWATAEAIRLVRAFVDEHTEPEDPIFAAPWGSLFYVLLERPNPTRYLAEHREGDFVMSAAMKREEMSRLLASDTRYALVNSTWWLYAQHPDTVLRTLIEHFRPIRQYGQLMILERTRDGGAERYREIVGRLRAGRGTDGDLAALVEIGREQPDEPLPQHLLATAMLRRGRTQDAHALLVRTHELDPANPRPLEELAILLLRAGRVREATEFARRARAVRESPMLRRLAPALAADGEAWP